jgi:hypothetical protein
MKVLPYFEIPLTVYKSDTAAATQKTSVFTTLKSPFGYLLVDDPHQPKSNNTLANVPLLSEAYLRRFKSHDLLRIRGNRTGWMLNGFNNSLSTACAI